MAGKKLHLSAVDFFPTPDLVLRTESGVNPVDRADYAGETIAVNVEATVRLMHARIGACARPARTGPELIG